MEKMIWLDMDGTFVDLYGVENWLPMLINEDVTPYVVAKPLLNMNLLARLLNRAKRKGYGLGVISWTSKNGTTTYNAAVAIAKRGWLANHLRSVKFDRIDIVPYGTPKQNGRYGYLFDDEAPNRSNWKGKAYKPCELIEFLKTL